MSKEFGRFPYIPKGENMSPEPIDVQVQRIFDWLEVNKRFATSKQQDGTTIWTGRTDKGLSFSQITDDNQRTDELTITGPLIGGQLSIHRSHGPNGTSKTSIKMPDSTSILFETSPLGTTPDPLRLSRALNLKEVLKSLLD